MNPNLFFAASVAAVALVSCAPKVPPPTEAEVLAKLDPNRWQVQNDIRMEGIRNVTYGSDIKAYPMGRYVDPANKDVMHERHVIYRRERPEQWRRDSSGREILIGPTVGLRNPIARTTLREQQLTVELNRQKVVTNRLLAVERSAAAGDARAERMLEEARLMRGNQEKIIEKLDKYEADRAASGGGVVPAPLIPPR